MTIRDHLRPGEAIISDHEPFYATSQRVILYQEKEGAEEIHEIPYGRLTSVETVKVVRHKAMIAGTILVIGGVMMMATVGFMTSPLAILGGIGALIYGAMGREAYFQLHAHGMTEEEQALWRLDYWGNVAFIRTVRNIIGDRSEA